LREFVWCTSWDGKEGVDGSSPSEGFTTRGRDDIVIWLPRLLKYDQTAGVLIDCGARDLTLGLAAAAVA